MKNIKLLKVIKQNSSKVKTGTAIVLCTIGVYGISFLSLEETTSTSMNNTSLAGVSAVTMQTEKQICVETSSVDTVGEAEPISEDTVENTNLYSEGDIVYATSNVSIRDDASTDGSYLGTLEKTEPAQVVSTQGDWVEIQYEDSTAYVNSEYVDSETPLIACSSTAYYNEYDRDSCTGNPLVEGVSVAAKPSWVGYAIEVYEKNSDGSVGDYRGTYIIDDTGYGQETGQGQSALLPGKTVGTIENGTCVDFYFDDKDSCDVYGRQDIYIKVIR